MPETPLPATGRTTGLDAGLTTLGTVVDEWMDVENPRHLKRAASDLKRKRRSWSKKTSEKHKEAARLRVARAERKVADTRSDYQHKQAGRLLAYYDAVGYKGDLAPKNMMRRAKPRPDPDKPGSYLHNGQSRKRGLNRSTADAAWTQFLFVLAFQAVKLAKFAIPYPKSGTTQDCSECGTKAKVRLEELAPAIGTGMRSVPSGVGAEPDAVTAERLRDRLDELDAVRARGEVESRSAYLGRSPSAQSLVLTGLFSSGATLAADLSATGLGVPCRASPDVLSPALGLTDRDAVPGAHEVDPEPLS